MAIWAITVRAHMDRLVAAEIRRSVRSFGWGSLLFRTVRPSPFSTASTAYLFIILKLRTAPQPKFCKQMAPAAVWRGLVVIGSGAADPA